MVSITKQEAFELRDRGFEKYVKHTYSKHKHYFCVESAPALKELNSIRYAKTEYTKE